MLNKKLLLADLFGSSPLFTEVLEILRTRQFIDVIHPCDEEWTFLGTLSPLERALYTVIISPEVEIGKVGICPVSEEQVVLHCLNLFKFEQNSCPFIDKLTAIEKTCPPVILGKFMRELINSRLKVMEMNLPDIRLVPEFKITTSKKDVQLLTPMQLFEGIESMSVEEMLETSLKGTFMEPIIDIISSGKFRLGNQSIEPKEVFVRNMTVFEKALWTMDINLTDAYNKAAIELQELHKGGAFITAFSLLTLSSEGISGPSTHYLPRDEYLYDAFDVGLPRVRIVHGFGAGVLRKVVQDVLRHHPAVRKYRVGEPREGGAGVTIADVGRPE